MRNHFPKRVRLRKRSEFQAVQQRGRKLTTESFLVFTSPSPASPVALASATASSSPIIIATADVPCARLGITVSKKVGGAVVRNRVKRLVREAFRHRKTLFPGGLRVVFVAKAAAAKIGLSEVEREMERVCKRL